MASKSAGGAIVKRFITQRFITLHMENNLNNSLITSIASDLKPVTVDLTEVIFDSIRTYAKGVT